MCFSVSPWFFRDYRRSSYPNESCIASYTLSALGLLIHVYKLRVMELSYLDWKMKWNSGMEYGIERCMYTTTLISTHTNIGTPHKRYHANISEFADSKNCWFNFFKSAKTSHTFINSTLYFGYLEGGGNNLSIADCRSYKHWTETR